MSEKSKLICETCNTNEAVGVYAVPGVPFSCAYCKECIEKNAHPWWLLVANTASIGGLEEAAEWWKEMVQCTCERLNKSIEQFNLEVKHRMEDIE